MTWISWWIAVWAVCLGLAGCGRDEGPQIVLTAPPNVQIKHLRDIIPATTLVCLREPDGSKVATIRQSAAYIVDLKKVGSDCRRKLATVRDLIQNEQ